MAKVNKTVVELVNGGIFQRVIGRNLNYTTLSREGAERVDEAADAVQRIKRIVAEVKDAVPTSPRAKYLGRTPSKYSRTGREVLERMYKEGKHTFKPSYEAMVRRHGADASKWPKSELKKITIDGHRYSKLDMGHSPVDAVSYWNNLGRHYGAKSDEVRQWMLDSGNYELQPRSVNRSDGAALKAAGARYQPPAVLPTELLTDQLVVDILRDLATVR